MPESETLTIVSGQAFSVALIEQIKQLVDCDPNLNRAQLARQVCQWLNWKDPNGKLQTSSCSRALHKLADRGLITLPPKCLSRGKPSPRLPKDPVPAPDKLSKTLRGIKGLRITQIDAPNNPQEMETWNWLIVNQHPKGTRPIMGRQVRYLIESDHGVLGAASFNSAAWRLSARDQFIGWSEPAREDNLQKTVSLSGFLIREEVKVDNLASHLLGQLIKRLPEDWLALYGESPLRKLSREMPDLPASIAFRPSEIEVLKIFKSNRQSPSRSKANRSKKNDTHLQQS